MAKPRGLQEQTYSVVFAEGLAEGMDSYVVAGAKLLTATNVEMNKQNLARKRNGFGKWDPTALAPASPYGGTSTPSPEKVYSVNDELLAITRTRLWAYSPSAGKFVMKGEYGSYKGELFAAYRDSNFKYRQGDAVASNGYVISVFSSYNSGSAEEKMYSNIYDEQTGGLMYRYKLIQDTTHGGLNSVRVLRCGVGDKDIIAIYDETGDTLYAARLNTDSLTSSWVPTAIVAGGGTGCNHFDACSIGTAGFVIAFYDNIGGFLRISTFAPDGTPINAATPVAVTAFKAVAVCADSDLSNIHIAYHDNGHIYYREYNLAMTLQHSGTVKTPTGMTAAGTNARVGIVSNDAAGGNVLVIWGESAASAASVPDEVSLTNYREVNPGTGAVVGAELHQPYFRLASRPYATADGDYVFMLQSEMGDYSAVGPAAGAVDNPGHGLFLMRLSSTVTGTATAGPMVVSAVALGSGLGSKVSGRQPARQLLDGTGGVLFGQFDVIGPSGLNNSTSRDYQPNIYKFTAQALGMGKPLVSGSSKLLLGGVPSVYDGSDTYNVGSLMRPEIIAAAGAAGGSLTASGTYGIYVVQEWVDDRGNAVYSQTSLPVSVTLTAGQQTVALAIRPVGLDNKRDWWPTQQNFAQMKLSVYRTENGGDVYYYEGNVEINRAATDWYTFNVRTADTGVNKNQQVYRSGGELANTGLPSCSVGCSVGQRFFVRSDENKRRVYFSKPLTQGRSVEFDVSFSQLDFPDEIVAMASLDGAPVLFGSDQVYIVDGVGPSSSGQPAGAFALRTLAGAVGCVDQESAVALPMGGIIFRSRRGFYVLTSGGFEFVGFGVKDTAAAYPTTLQTVVDDDLGVVKFLVWDGVSTSRILCYYWATKQWTIHTPTLAGYMKTFCLHEGDYYAACASGFMYKSGAAGYTDFNGTKHVGYAQTIRFGWENAGDIQSRKRFWEIQPLLREKQLHQLRCKLYYNRYDSDVDTFDIPIDSLLTMTPMEKVRVQLPHGRGLSDCVSAEFSDVGDVFGPVTQSNTLSPVITIAGIPDPSVTQLVLLITVTGALGVAKGKFSKDGGTTWSTEATLTATMVLAGTGATVTFPAGTYTATDTYYSWPTFWDQGFELAGITYVLGVLPGADKLSKERTA